MLYHAHVQAPRGSGYMMQSGNFRNAQEAVDQYLALVDRDDNPFGRNALESYPDPLRVTLIPAHLHGPGAMAYIGFCNVWNADGSDAFETSEPDYELVPNPRYKRSDNGHLRGQDQ